MRERGILQAAAVVLRCAAFRGGNRLFTYGARRVHEIERCNGAFVWHVSRAGARMRVEVAPPEFDPFRDRVGLVGRDRVVHRVAFRTSRVPIRVRALVLGRRLRHPARANAHSLLPSGIAQIREVHAVAAQARRVFARGAAVRHTRGMPRVGFLGRLHGESDRAAVGGRGGLAVDRLGDGEHTARAHVEIALFVGHTRADTDRAEHRVVELLRLLETVDADHYMTEHAVPPFLVVDSCGCG